MARSMRSAASSLQPSRSSRGERRVGARHLPLLRAVGSAKRMTMGNALRLPVAPSVEGLKPAGNGGQAGDGERRAGCGVDAPYVVKSSTPEPTAARACRSRRRPPPQRARSTQRQLEVTEVTSGAGMTFDVLANGSCTQSRRKVLAPLRLQRTVGLERAIDTAGRDDRAAPAAPPGQDVRVL